MQKIGLLVFKEQRKATMISILVPNDTIGPKLGWTSVTNTIKKEEIALRYKQLATLDVFQHQPVHIRTTQ